MEQNAPQATSTPPNLQPSQPPFRSQTVTPVTKKKRAVLSVATLFIAILAVCVAGAALAIAASSTSKNDQQHEVKALQDRLATLEEQEKFEIEHVDEDKYQAVFLSNGQVYFGFVTDITRDTIKLEKIYYLRTGTVDKEGNSTVGNDVSLVKLGEELHGPEDVMMIERKNVLFWENLKEDSQVSKAMDDHKRSNR